MTPQREPHEITNAKAQLALLLGYVEGAACDLTLKLDAGNYVAGSAIGAEIRDLGVAVKKYCDVLNHHMAHHHA